MAHDARIRLLVTSLALLSVVAAQSRTQSKAITGPCSPNECGVQGERYGDVIIGGLFPVHKASKDEQGAVKCEDLSRTLNEFGFERLEAMRYAILKANEEKLLGDIKIGYEMRDTCQDSSYALRESLSFLNIEAVTTPNYRFTVGVAGAASSGISTAVTDLLNLFGVPLVSYASTSAALSDSKRYPSFFRTLPPDKFQAEAMVDIVKRFGWRYVHTAHSSDLYGKAGIQEFIKAAKEARIDIGTQMELSRGDGDVEKDRAAVQAAVRKVLGNVTDDNPLSRGNLMVIFAHLDVAKNLMAAIKNTTKLKDRNFTFIGSDSWGDKVEAVYDPDEDINSIDVARGMLSVIPESVKVAEFEEHMKNLNPKNYTEKQNPWFAQYWEKQFGCDPRGNTNASIVCQNNNSLASVSHHLDSKVAYVIDAVNVFVYALRNLLKDKCNGKLEMCSNVSLCFNETQFCSSEFKEYIQNVTFPAQSKVDFKFDKGDFVQAKYDIKNLHINKKLLPPQNIDFINVGVWQLSNTVSDNNDSSDDSNLQFLAEEKIVWITGKSGVDNAPVENCSNECQLGQFKFRLRVGMSGEKAYTCWRCEDCNENHHYVSYESSSYGECQPCQPDATNNEQHTGCIKLEVEYLEHGDGLAVFLIILAIVGITLVSITFAAFFAKWGTPIVMASSRELSVVLLSGLLLCFLLTFVFIGEPTDITCGIQRFCPVMFLSMVFGALLIKTNRISRLFNRAANVQRPPFISPLSQVVFTGIIVIMSCCIAAVWLLISPPEAETQIDTNNFKVIRICKNLVDPGLLITWLWIFALIIVCTYYGFRTRKIPENFRETMFISFAAYSECIIWLAFIPFGFIGLDDQYITAIVALAIMLSALAAWGCLFVPKLYIVLLRPERNRRQSTMRRSSRPSMGDTGNVGSYTQGTSSSDEKENGDASHSKPARLNSVHFINAV
ncbi:metabotropic glutamate receptor 8-like [Corticium candelabrum]|uniref:metabotropic glutamate receptor 8-like n=1 Tax=Corticium candelabrum TaxID=121492 RepID=UPI002E270AD8|nr:metabotropic glutamate receptor 8-like [Corticium candelabrum]